MSAPASASARVIARPIPRLAPVTRAVRPDRSIWIGMWFPLPRAGSLGRLRCGGGQAPGAWAIQQRADQLIVERVTGAGGLVAAADGVTDQGEVAEGVEDLVADEVV